jgi:PAS domain S-box-containing protein
MTGYPIGEEQHPLADERQSARVTELEAALAEQRAVVQRLERSEERLRTLVENSPDSVTVMDVEGKFLYVNRAFAPRKISDLIGTSAISYMAPEPGARFVEALREVVATGEPRTIEVESDGRRVWEARLVPLKRDGRVTAVMGIGADVTQRRLAEEALRRSEEKSRIASRSAGMGIWSWEPERDVLVLDALGAAMLGLPADETMTSFAAILPRLHLDDQGRITAAARAFTETGVLEELETRVVLGDGQTRWVVVSGARAEDGPSGAPLFIGSLFDVKIGRAHV